MTPAQHTEAQATRNRPGSQKPGLLATLLHAAQLLASEAASLRESHTHNGRWGSEHEARRAHKELCDSAKALRKAAAYMQPNPLGGPAKVFDACADAIRAGEPVHAAMADYGLAWSDRATAAVPAPAAPAEPIAWRPNIACTPPQNFNAGKPKQQDIDYWRSMGCGIEYAYAKTPRAFAIPEPGTPWWQTAKDCGAWTDKPNGDVGYVHFGSIEALRVYTAKITKQAATAPATADPADPDMRHPKIQRLIGSNARKDIEMRLVEELLDDPDADMSPMAMEYWNNTHDKLRAALKASAQPALAPVARPRLTHQQIMDLRIFQGAGQQTWFDKAGFARAIEAACAEAWGITLAGSAAPVARGEQS